MNDFVPSIGSRIQRKPLVPRLLGQFFAQNAVVGKRGGDAAPQVLLGRAGRRRDGRIVTLQFHVEIVAAEVLQCDLAGLFRRLNCQGKTRFKIAGIATA